jgi:hypothetical protein
MTIVTKVVTTVGVQGPMGPTGPPGEEEMTYSKRVDWVSDSVLYKGEAAVGSGESAAVWRIRKIVLGADDDVTETWAEGVATFTHAWTDRLTKVYS